MMHPVFDRYWVALRRAVFLLCLGQSTQSDMGALPGDIEPEFSPRYHFTSAPDSLAIQDEGKLLVKTGTNLFRFEVDGELDSSFVSKLPPLNIYEVRAATGRKTLVYGISKLDGKTLTLVRLENDGEIDSSFNPEFVERSEQVRSFAPAMDGSVIYFANVFSADGSRTGSHIQRVKDDGSIDSGFQSVDIQGVSVLLECADGTILAGGTFNQVNGQSASNLIRLSRNGLLLPQPALSFQIVSSGSVPNIYSIAEEPDGKVLIGGLFYEINGRKQNHVARINVDGTLDTNFTPPELNGAVRAIHLQLDGKIILIGNFTHADRHYRKSIARLESDGRLDEGFALGPAPYTGVLSGALSSNHLFVGTANISSSGTYLYSVFRLPAGDLPPGAPSTAIAPENVSRLQNENLELAVSVRSSSPASFQWRLNGREMVDATNSFLSFTRLTFQDSGTYTLVASNQFGTMTSPPIEVAVNAAPVLAGTLDPIFDPGTGFDQPVTAIALQESNIVAAGKFKSYNGGFATNLVRLLPNGAMDSTFDAGTGFTFSFNCDALTVEPDGKLYVGADYRYFNGVEQRAIVRLGKDGELDRTFAPTLGSGAVVGDIQLQDDGALLVAGCRDVQCSASVWRMTGEGAIDAAFTSDSKFTSGSHRAKLAVQRDGKILVGAGMVGGGLLRLMPDGSRDETFQAPASLNFAQVSSIIELPDGRILVGSRLRPLQVLKQHGELEKEFPFSFIVHRLHLLQNGDILAAGDSTLRRITESLVPDTNFICRVNGPIYAMAVQADGNIMIGGGFTTVNGLPRQHIARVFGSERTAEPFVLGPRFSEAGLEVRVPTLANRNYRLEWKQKLGDSEWTPLESVTGDGSHLKLSDSTPESGQRFYRVRVE